MRSTSVKLTGSIASSLCELQAPALEFSLTSVYPGHWVRSPTTALLDPHLDSVPKGPSDQGVQALDLNTPADLVVYVPMRFFFFLIGQRQLAGSGLSLQLYVEA